MKLFIDEYPAAYAVDPEEAAVALEKFESTMPGNTEIQRMYRARMRIDIWWMRKALEFEDQQRLQRAFSAVHHGACMLIGHVSEVNLFQSSELMEKKGVKSFKFSSAGPYDARWVDLGDGSSYVQSSKSGVAHKVMTNEALGALLRVTT